MIARPGRRKGRFALEFVMVAALVAGTLILGGTAQRGGTAVQLIPRGADDMRLVPEELADTSWLQRLKDEQIKALAGVSAFHDFQFTDRLKESGITFRHRIVDDAGKDYKAAHYDHGNGIAMADVDGDGLIDIYFVNQVGGNQLWRNLGGGRFEDITAAAGVALADRVNVSASFADIDNDGHP